MSTLNSLGALVGLNLNIPHVEVPTPVSLAVIFGVLALSMLLSCFSRGFVLKKSSFCK
jgi:tellurite resistance protein TerC